MKKMRIGALYRAEDGSCSFAVWAPLRDRVELLLSGPLHKEVDMEKDGEGYWSARVEGAVPGTRYLYRLDGGEERPDPASFSQPDGVHRASAVVDHGSFAWSDGSWGGLPLRDMVFYEIHVGTFTPEGTFDTVIPRLDDLHDLGVTALEIMPVAQFPGTRNWGYDGVHPFAVQNSFGGHDGLKRLVDACHRRGLAVVLDVVYNHLGPEGNYLSDFAPYFTGTYRTPWGEAVNFDGPRSDGVRDFFVSNARYWRDFFHVDALRLDAVHAIFDTSARPFLRELADGVREGSAAARPLLLIAESDLNEPRLTRPRAAGGYGLDSQWNDDFHHSLRTLITAERDGYYRDYGTLGQFEKAWKEAFVYTGEYSAYRGRRHGSPADDLPGESFVVFSQNHDQVGNRMLGERLASLVSFETLKLAAGAVLLSPYLPLLFMGEEYGEEAPFLYFADHGDPGLRDAVRRGRLEEFSAFISRGEPLDPFDVETSRRSVLRWEQRREGRGSVLCSYYARLLRLRRMPSFAPHLRTDLATFREDGEALLLVTWRAAASAALLALNFSPRDSHASPLPRGGPWRKVVDSSEKRWSGPGSPLPPVTGEGEAVVIPSMSAALFEKVTPP